MQFKNIDINKLLYQRTRSFFAINSSGELSVMYKFLFACLYPLQNIFFAYDNYRRQQWLIANCAWQNTQATNLLNHLYDPILKRITISSGQEQNDYLPSIDKSSSEFLPSNDKTSSVYWQTIDKRSISLNELSIGVPNDLFIIPNIYNQIDTTLKYLIFAGQIYIIKNNG